VIATGRGRWTIEWILVLRGHERRATSAVLEVTFKGDPGSVPGMPNPSAWLYWVYLYCNISIITTEGLCYNNNGGAPATTTPSRYVVMILALQYKDISIACQPQPGREDRTLFARTLDISEARWVTISDI